MPFSRNLGERYSPLYFLNAFTSGALAASFFMYLFWLARSNLSALPSANVVYVLGLQTGIVESALTFLSLAGFLFFSIHHALLLKWNMRQLKQWKQTQTYKVFEKSADKTVLMTISMTATISMILIVMSLCLFLPWIFFDVIEYVLFAVFCCLGYIGWHTMKILYASVASKDAPDAFDDEGRSNLLGRMICLFALLILGLAFGLVSTASSIKLTLFLAYAASLACIGTAVFLCISWFLPKVDSFWERKASPESSSLLWLGGGLFGLLFLSWHYMRLAATTALGGSYDTTQILQNLLFCATGSFLCGLIGRKNLVINGLLSRLLGGSIYAAGLYAVVCPTLLLLLLAQYLINAVLLPSGLLQPWSFYYFLFYLPILIGHGYIIRLYLRLNSKLFSSADAHKPSASRQ